ncbi:MAG: hypothetical protein JWO13_1130 [Acidobacteriales bacterium]|nr:hypothetical protein [Terriglobales bacterium]
MNEALAEWEPAAEILSEVREANGVEGPRIAFRQRKAPQRCGAFFFNK